MPKSPLLSATLVLSLLSPASALQLRSYDPASHDRFLNFPSSPTHNPGFIHAAVDMSGVGWDTADTRRQLTFVSPKHFVGARHWMPAIGATIRCVDSNNVLRSYQVATQHNILNNLNQATDLFIGTITTTIPASDHVGFHPYLKLANEAAYVNQSLAILGQPARGGIGRIESFLDISGDGLNLTRTFIFRYDPPPPNNLPDDDCYGELYDSGSPSFVLSNGKAAIVGTHTSIGTQGSDQLTYDTFVPHYIDKLDVIMAADGYHMTDANPTATTLAITQVPPAGTIRAGYPFTITIDLENTGANNANNLKFTDILPAGAVDTNLTGTAWVASPAAGGILPALKGGLDAAATSSLDLTLTIPLPGSYQQEVAVSADEFSSTHNVVPLNVIESYLSWSAGLASGGYTDDDDGDGIPNLTEYGFHGDPDDLSPHAIGTSVDMLPAVEAGPGNNLTYRYLARNDAATRGLSYAVEYSDLLTGGWQDATPLILNSSYAAVSADLDQVSLEFAAAPQLRRYFRVRITLTEA